VTADDAKTFARCMHVHGVAVFPADTVYGLACDPDDAAAIERLYALKGRERSKPAAIMRFSLDGLPPLEPRTERAARALLPGPVTLLVPDPAGGVLGLRVPQVPLLAGVSIAVLQTSANHAGGPDARRLADVPPDIRAGADLEIDGGELPGTPSTVVDLTEYETAGRWTVVREGALPADALGAVL
jgi:L-threonylcarbamoyladenylate synthase